jgi:hypothetical protein
MTTNFLLTNYAQLTHQQAWFVTMIWIGAYNYCMLKANWGKKKTPLADVISDDEKEKLMSEKSNV